MKIKHADWNKVQIQTLKGYHDDKREKGNKKKKETNLPKSRKKLSGIPFSVKAWIFLGWDFLDRIEME